VHDVRGRAVSDDEPFFDGVHPYPVARPRTNNDRSQIAKIAANTRWANESDRSAATQPARDAMRLKFERQVDPEGRLPADERAIRAESARRAHYQRLALKSAQARRQKRGKP
jgi:hypothetical protein